jgi:hypothetical protein
MDEMSTFMTLVSQIRSNSFRIKIQEKSNESPMAVTINTNSIGFGIYLNASMINHRYSFKF